ncbi:hypothetical protein [Mycobacterium avium]|nr:hypothetical protein [Mycobacterium avium]
MIESATSRFPTAPGQGRVNLAPTELIWSNLDIHSQPMLFDCDPA